MSPEQQESAVGDIVSDYREATRRLEVLLEDAEDIGGRLLRLGHGLSAHPTRMIIGAESRAIEEPSEWEIFPRHPLPTLDDLIKLTDDIRETQQTVEELRERLILMGVPDLAEPPDKFFE